jgi:rhodanese-related sulfurtransferase
MEHLGQFITNHLLLWVSFVVIIILILINELISNKQKANEISPHAVVDLMNNENAVILDIRDQESYKKGHIIDAVNMKADEIDETKMNKYKNKSVVIVCAQGTTAQGAASKLKQKGIDAKVLRGGMNAWISADLPLIKGKG